MNENVIKHVDKDDSTKPRLDLVPIEDIWVAIAKVREYGIHKYPDYPEDNWKNISSDRWRAALYRHVAAEVNDPGGMDKESGMPHMWHIATNVAFILATENNEKENKNGKTCKN